MRPGQPVQRLGGEDAVVTVVDDDTDLHRSANGIDVAVEPLLLDVEQVLRQDEDPVGPFLLGGAGELDRHRRAVTGAGDNRQPALSFTDRGAHDLAALVERQREELPRAAGREEGDGAVLDVTDDAGAVGRLVEGAIGAEMRHRKSQQTRADDGPEARGIHGHVASVLSSAPGPRRCRSPGCRKCRPGTSRRHGPA